MRCIADAGATALFVSGAHAARITAECLRAVRLRVAVDVSAAASPGVGAWSDFHAWKAAQSPDAPTVELVREGDCTIIYSSGTTGQPKGIVHTYGARLDWAHDLAHALRYDSAARTLIATGLYSNITRTGSLGTLLLGGTLVVLPAFDAGAALRAIERERISHLSMVPVQYHRLLVHPKFAVTDLNSLRAVMSCGSALPERTKAVLLEFLPCGVIELYGATDGLITTLPPEEAAGRVTSVGKPLPAEDLLILDDEDRPVADGTPGEIVAHSRFMMRGYWNRPDATAQAFWRDPAISVAWTSRAISTSRIARKMSSSPAARTSIRPTSKRS